jgi:threonine/homoserine/homoserine lactone efflux protein
VLFLISLAATSFVLGLTGSLMPGPLMFAVINRARKGGTLVGIRMTAGHGLAEFALAAALLLVTQLLSWDVSKPNPTVIGAVAIVGGLLLGLLGGSATYSALKPPKSPAQPDVRPASNEARSDIIAGAGISAMNPYWSTWWLLSGLPLLLFGYIKAGLLGFFIVMVPHVASDLVVYAIIAYLIHRGVTYMGTKGYRYVEGASGLAMASFGILFITLGLNVCYTGQIPYVGEAPKL